MVKDRLLEKKSVDFAVKIVQFYKCLCEEKREYVLAKQVLRSGTSIGANIRESRNAQSKADFMNKLNVALKEADETQYWFEVLEKSEIINPEDFEMLNKDLSELIAILVSSIKTLKNNLKSK
jgi:four helix bundle protein